MLYRATLRVMLVILHDFPEFLSAYHHSLIELLPHSCIQMKNLILSAFPQDMRLPDPFTPNLKVNLLPEISQHPLMLSDYTHRLVGANLKQDLDLYLKSRSPKTVPSILAYSFLTKDSDVKYDTSLISSVILYIGVSAIAELPSDGPLNLKPTIGFELVSQLLNDTDNEGNDLIV